MANAGASVADLAFELPGFATVAARGTAEVLAGARSVANTPATPGVLVPARCALATGRRFGYTAPAWSVSVLTFEAR